MSSKIQYLCYGENVNNNSPTSSYSKQLNWSENISEIKSAMSNNHTVLYPFMKCIWLDVVYFMFWKALTIGYC